MLVFGDDLLQDRTLLVWVRTMPGEIGRSLGYEIS
jgi:hypothetical protein